MVNVNAELIAPNWNKRTKILTSDVQRSFRMSKNSMQTSKKNVKNVGM